MVGISTHDDHDYITILDHTIGLRDPPVAWVRFTQRIVNDGNLDVPLLRLVNEMILEVLISVVETDEYSFSASCRHARPSARSMARCRAPDLCRVSMYSSSAMLSATTPPPA